MKTVVNRLYGFQTHAKTSAPSQVVLEDGNQSIVAEDWDYLSDTELSLLRPSLMSLTGGWLLREECAR